MTGLLGIICRCYVLYVRPVGRYRSVFSSWLRELRSHGVQMIPSAERSTLPMRAHSPIFAVAARPEVRAS